MKQYSFIHPLLKVLGVDARQFVALYTIKLKMDFRRTPGSFQAGSTQMTHMKQMFLYAFVGLMILLILKDHENKMVSYTIFFGILMFMCGSSLLMEFTSVLFDENENYILLPRPVSSRTLLFVRVAHILTYISLIAYSFSLPTIVYVALYSTMDLIPFILSVFQASWFTLFLVYGFYILMSKIVSGDRFKDIINYIQIGLTVFIVAGYQLLPRIFEFKGLKISLTLDWWGYLVPPIWFAAFSNYLHSNMHMAETLLSLISIFSCLISAFVVVRLLGNKYNDVLGSLSVANRKREVSTTNEKNKRSIFDQVASLFCISNVEKQGWYFANSISKRDRKFKLQVYPTYAYALIFTIIIFIPKKGTEFSLEQIAESRKYIGFIFLGVLGMISLNMLSFSNTPQASWIYKKATLPLINELHSGAIKLMLFKFMLPVNLFFCIVTFSVWGIEEVLYVLLGNLLIVAYAVFNASRTTQAPPFSLHYDEIKKGSYATSVIISFLITGVIIGFVYLLTMVPIWVSLITWIVAILLVLGAFRRVRKRKRLLTLQRI